MLQAILIVLIILSFFKTIYNFYDKNSKKLISEAANIDEANEIRTRLFKKRKKIVAVFFTVVVLIVVGVTIIDYERFLLMNILVLVILFIEARYDISKTEFYGNISYQTPEGFVSEHEEFYLYLRGFNDDVPFGEEDDKDDNGFDESMFTEVVDYALGIPCCTLGMTKEVDAPIGATRVYVNDADWQEKVLGLMQKAKGIYILVNDRNSCIWEIEQSLVLLDKTVFFVSDYSKYNNIKRRFADVIDMPDAKEEDVPFFFKNGSEATGYSNTMNGYFEILGLDAHEVEERKAKEIKEKMLGH